MFEKNLNDLVRGIRANKSNEAKYIAQCIEEIKHELRQDNTNVKANAICKLIYLQMFGYDISWAAFNVIEVMSSTKFTHKRIGYLASSQCFTEDMDILTLTTNLIRKDFSSQNQYDAAVTLNGLSCFVSADLARDLANDVITLLASTKPYIRKRAIIVLYKIFLKFPEALRPAYPRLKAKLDDPEPSVQSAAVNVICELARKNPQNYLSLAPIFFKLMTNSTNNWMLIKIIKLFAALTPLEPRLGKKLIEPLTNLIHSTSAMSLLYECINTVIAVLLAFTSMPNHSSSVQLCVSKLRLLIEDADQNLKYLGLLAMSKILKAHPKAVQAHKDMILRCLDDKDESIKLRALDLLSGMISKKNLVEIVKKLMRHIETTESTSYRDELLSKIIHICSQSNYQYVADFEWYISVLVELAQVDGIHHGSLVATQLLDVTVRVKGIRGFSVQQMTMLLENSKLMGITAQGSSTGDVFFAAAWIVGEFSEHLSDLRSIMHIFLQPRATSLPPPVQAVIVHNILKLYSRIYLKAENDNDQDTIAEVTQMLIDQLPMFGESSDLEVQERACCAIQMLKYIQKIRDKGLTVTDEVREMFAGELNPVATKAQKKVPVPEGLNLDIWINDPPSDSSDDELNNDAMFVTEEDHNISNIQGIKYPKVDEDELKKRREARKLEQENNPYYIKGNTKSKELEGPDINDIPVASLDLTVPLKVPGKESVKKSKRKKKKGRKHDTKEDNDNVVATHDVNTDMGEMPEGAVSTDDEEKEKKDPYNFLNVDLEKPLTEADMIPVPKHHEASNKPADDTETAKNKLKKTKKKKDKEKTKGKKSSNSKKDKSSKRKKGIDIVPPNDTEEAVEANLISDETVPALTTPELSQNSKSTGEKELESVTNKMDDINFWLTNNDTSSAGHITIPDATVNPANTVENNDVNEKSRKGKKDKKRKKKGKKVKPSTESRLLEMADQPSEQTDLVEVTSDQPEKYASSYILLGESEDLKMTCKTQINPQFRNQVIVSIIFSNKTDFIISSLEFNVLDTLNTKLQRPININPVEAISVPFQLQSNTENESQFAFDIQSIVMPQKLRGTLTYMFKNEEGTSHEKIDFKLALPCSSYLYPENCSRKEFTEILASGILQCKQSIKIKVDEESDFRAVLGRMCSLLHASVIEQIDGGASLYASSIQRHHICLLVKMMATNILTVDAKSTESMLLSHLLDEIKAEFS